jgi:single-strand DNA-binding protein
MRSNQCFIIGNLGGDPVERSRGGKGQAIVGFTVAENVQTFDQESKTWKTLHTNWFPVTAFGAVAEKARVNLKKGDRVAIQGRMKIAKYKDKQGEERTGFEIIAEDVGLWKSLPSTQGAGESDGQSRRGRFDAVNEESLPF